MSFICPNCDFHDDPAWRNAYYDPHTSIINWDDFKTKYPHLWKTVLTNRFVIEYPYAYEREPRHNIIKYVKRGTIAVFNERGQTLHLIAGYTSRESEIRTQKTNLHDMVHGKL